MVLSQGGRVSQSGLVGGVLDMATGFGFGDIKGLTREPSITCIPKAEILPNSHLVIATRGVFEKTSQGSIVNYVHEKRDREPLDLAHDIVYSVESGRSENPSLSCLIVKLESSTE